MKYKFIPEMDDCFSTDCRKCKIHACFSTRGNDGDCLVIKKSQNVRIIKPSAFIWTNWNCGNEIINKDKEVYRVCYSNHSGYNEIQDFIKYLQPKRIELNVVSDNLTKMNGYLNEIMCKYQIESSPERETLTNKNIYFTNIQLNGDKKKTPIKLEQILMEDNDYDGGRSHLLLKRRRTNLNL